MTGATVGLRDARAGGFNHACRRDRVGCCGSGTGSSLRLLLTAFLTIPALFGSLLAAEKPPAEARLIAEFDSLTPGRTHRIGVLFTIQEGWHLYWRNPGESGMPPSVTWNVPGGWRLDGPRWPVPKAFDSDGIVGYGFENEVLLQYDLFVPQTADPTSKINLAADVLWLACRDICVPGDAKLELTLPISSGKPVAGPHAATFEKLTAQLPRQEHGWTFTATRNDDTIRLTGKPEKDRRWQNNAEIAFFPWEPGMVADSARIVGTHPEQEVVVTVRAQTDRHRALKVLRGILNVPSDGRPEDRDVLMLEAPIAAHENKGQ